MVRDPGDGQQLLAAADIVIGSGILGLMGVTLKVVSLAPVMSTGRDRAAISHHRMVSRRKARREI